MSTEKCPLEVASALASNGMVLAGQGWGWRMSVMLMERVMIMMVVEVVEVDDKSLLFLESFSVWR